MVTTLNSLASSKPQTIVKSTLRLATGITFAFLIYQLALKFATGDCASIQSEIRANGPSMMLVLLGSGSFFALVGFPAALIAAVAGLLMGPISGASLASTALVVGSLIAWTIARSAFKNGVFPPIIEKRLHGAWYENMMEERTSSGFHWVLSNAINCPLPFSFFAALVGAKVRHLNLQSLIAGIFASTFFYVAAYALTGASIGCAVINHANGFDVSQYRNMMIVSCILLIALAQIQSNSKPRRKT
jgi:uncharacterized membrane protein YdjX (TVP38/TMEM64 family)